MERRLGDLSVCYEVDGEGRPILLIHGDSPGHPLMKGYTEAIFDKVGAGRGFTSTFRAWEGRELRCRRRVCG